MGTHEHKQDAPRQVTIAILTLSTTRTIKDDTGGNWIKETAKQLGHTGHEQDFRGDIFHNLTHRHGDSG